MASIDRPREVGSATRLAGENRRSDRVEAAPRSEGKPGTVDEVFPPPRTFWWLPMHGQRHAIHEYDHATSTGEPVHTLCGATHDRPAPPTDAQWLWSTCELCWDEACKIVRPQ